MYVKNSLAKRRRVTFLKRVPPQLHPNHPPILETSPSPFHASLNHAPRFALAKSNTLPRNHVPLPRVVSSPSGTTLLRASRFKRCKTRDSRSLTLRHVSLLPSPHRSPRGTLRTFYKHILFLRSSITKDLAVHPSLTLPLRVANRHPRLLRFCHVSLRSSLIKLINSPFFLSQ
ncbi:unnamed protein product [Sphenostylis stenocarpa]|uniref:Uncharacterized protein n=1 Tax=Sphenostylis stenocarpa TaxID=92480 RepID=A0AA86SGX4_9FABA|nr:unnamed protein product [Sphenostylis stenocarpa]